MTTNSFRECKKSLRHKGFSKSPTCLLSRLLREPIGSPQVRRLLGLVTLAVHHRQRTSEPLWGCVLDAPCGQRCCLDTVADRWDP